MFIDEFLRKLPQWVGKVQPHRDYDLHIKQPKPDDAYKSLANYICKGCEPAFIDHFHLTELHTQYGGQGTFWGKRAGVSPSLNKTARDTVGYDAKRRRLPVTHAQTEPFDRVAVQRGANRH
jgi:hypothetical protein